MSSLATNEGRVKKTILLAAPRGFCAGVDRAIQIVEKSIEKYGAPVYVRHEIVHNRHVVTRLEQLGAIRSRRSISSKFNIFGCNMSTCVKSSCRSRKTCECWTSYSSHRSPRSSRSHRNNGATT